MTCARIYRAMSRVVIIIFTDAAEYTNAVAI